MCGRFAQHSEPGTLKKVFQIEEITCEVMPRYNIAPLQPVLVIIGHDGNRRLGRVNWGLVPSWSKDTRMAAKLINAREETLADKPSFRAAFRYRRCLILADGFYEWELHGRRKQPWYFTLHGEGPFAFAGLWETWKGKKEEVYHSCTIVTTAANKVVQPIHDRMPVILSPTAYAAWLDPTKQDAGPLTQIIRDGRIHRLKRFPVSKRVNSIRNNDPACIEPIEVEAGE